MILYHATPAVNLESIQRHGLLPGKAQGGIKGVWLHTASRRAWAILHTIKRHSLKAFDDVVLLKVKVQRSNLTRRKFGIWTTDKVVTHFEIVHYGKEL